MKALIAWVVSVPLFSSRLHAVCGHEEVCVVTVELRALEVVDRVLDREAVQSELFLERREVLLRGVREVDPDRRLRVLDVVGDVGEREVLEIEDAFAIQAGVDHALMLRPHAHAGPE